jgi:phasin family protein
MADTETAKSDVVAEKAYAEAAGKVSAPAAPSAPVAAKAEPVKAEAPVMKAEGPAAKAAPAPNKARAAKPARKPATLKSPLVKTAKVKTAAKPKPVAIKAPARKIAVAKVAKPATITKPANIIQKLKETTMATTTKKTADDFTAKIQDAVKDAQARAKTAMEKSQAMFGEAGEFTKGNLEALVESTKILASGVQTMGKSYVEETKSTFEKLQGDIKDITKVKSPTEFVQMQGTLMRKYFDNAVAYNSKNSEAMLKLVNDAFQPISNRVSLAVEKVKQAA